ncbi:DR2241 family protein, partial [Halobium palmae]
RYRPLKTAPTLRRGWLFTDLSGAELVDCVDAFYPATVANWYREREGDLDVTDWTETAERQTGIYDVIDELDREAVERIAASCCVDSQCLKRRQWDYDEESELAAPRGDEAFPCREPCSLVVAAARKWTKLEREESRSYEFELTPSEKEQLEDLIDAVADDRIDEIREADLKEGANRYRARYLREKRVDADGTLSGTPTDGE